MCHQTLVFLTHTLQTNISFALAKSQGRWRHIKVDSLPLQLTLATLTNSLALAMGLVEPSSCGGSLYRPALSDLYQTSGLKTSNNMHVFNSVHPNYHTS